MIQQGIAIIFILYFLVKLFKQKKKGEISPGEFIFWLVFWMLAAFAIVFLKQIDALVSGLGFTGSGIEVLLYFGISLLFYMIFKLRIKLEKMDKDITKIVREIAINNKDK